MKEGCGAGEMEEPPRKPRPRMPSKEGDMTCPIRSVAVPIWREGTVAAPRDTRSVPTVPRAP